MSKITFSVDYPQSFRRGVSCPTPPTITLDVEPSTISQEDRGLIAERLRENGEVASYAEEGGIYRSPRTVKAMEPTVLALVAAIRIENEAVATYSQRKEAEAAAKHAALRKDKLAEMLAEPNVQNCSARVWLLDNGTILVRDYNPGNAIASDTARFIREYITYYGADVLTPEEAAEYKARHDRLDAASDAKQKAVVAEVAAKLKAEHWQPRLDWIAAHGSVRLQRLAAEDIDFAATYSKEHDSYEEAQLNALLNSERPNWYAVDKNDLDYGISDVSMRTLALLDAGRKLAPTCKLAKLKATGKYVVVEEFQGRLIVWPKD